MGKHKLLVLMLALSSVSLACGSEDDPITDAGFPVGQTTGGTNTGSGTTGLTNGGTDNGGTSNGSSGVSTTGGLNGATTGTSSSGGTSSGGISTGGTSTGGTTGGSSTGAMTGGTTGGTTGSSTGGTTGSGTTGGTTGGDEDDAGMPDPGPDMGCGPMRGADPTEASVTTKGPFAVKQYTSGIPTSASYGATEIFYPENAPLPLPGVAVVPGFNGVLTGINQWGTFLASHGYIVLTVDAKNRLDDVNARSQVLAAGVTTLKAENARQGSPVNGKLATNCMVVMGHSMGGAGSLVLANKDATLKAVVGLSPYTSGGKYPNIKAATLVFSATSELASANGHAWPSYNSIPASVPKMSVEFSGGDHQIAQFPLDGNNPATDKLVARYGLSWLKFNVDGDMRYKQFLVKATGTVKFETTVN
jgi:triacylglycerol lipase